MLEKIQNHNSTKFILSLDAAKKLNANFKWIKGISNVTKKVFNIGHKEIFVDPSLKGIEIYDQHYSKIN